MVVKKWLLRTLSEILEHHDLQLQHQISHEQNHGVRANRKAQREWVGAIKALEHLLIGAFDNSNGELNQRQGLILSAPVPVLTNSVVLSQVHTGVFTPEAFNPLALMPNQLRLSKTQQQELGANPVVKFPLLHGDPLAKEQFCLVLTPKFSVILVLGANSLGHQVFQFSFEPEVIKRIWKTLRARLTLTSPFHLNYLDKLVEQFAPPEPDYRIITHFSRQLLKYLPDEPTIVEMRSVGCESHGNYQEAPPQVKKAAKSPQNLAQEHLFEPHNSSPEIELLRALTHEIRTPLTTIRMLTRSLLKKRCRLGADITKRLETIDQECTEQINRMELIFKAVELETTTLKQQGLQLCSVPLEQWFEGSIARWQKQAKRRNVVLDIKLPEQLPTVVSNPAMLDQVLTGLIENFTRKLPTGGQVNLQVTTAGNQLKLQFLSEANCPSNPFKSLGNLLMFQPETGSLSLNLDVTKNLFQALGGKLTVRQRPHKGEVLTVFLPLGSSQFSH